MQTCEIMLIHRLPTGTAFGITVKGNEAVFIPAKVTAALAAGIGEKFNAILIENTTMPEKTPWMAIRLDRADIEAENVTGDRLADLILADLNEDGSATAKNVADSINFTLNIVTAKLQELARKGNVYRRTFYAANEADFDWADE
jgi:hypothetical protein